jgi:hypothetical protein
MFVREDGPGDIFARIRYWAGIRWDEFSRKYSNKFLGKMLMCVWCTSVWISAIASILLFPEDIWTYILYVFSLSAVAIAFDEAMQKWFDAK